MILFLDFDGVLHPKANNGEPLFCRAELLWQILRACPSAEVVFSTSWRELYKFDEMLDFVTSGGGEELAHRIIGSTPILTGRSHDREAECLAWLAECSRPQRPWLALDDTGHWFSGPNLYLVDPATGLTQDDAFKIVEQIQWRDSNATNQA